MKSKLKKILDLNPQYAKIIYSNVRTKNKTKKIHRRQKR